MSNTWTLYVAVGYMPWFLYDKEKVKAGLRNRIESVLKETEVEPPESPNVSKETHLASHAFHNLECWDGPREISSFTDRCELKVAELMPSGRRIIWFSFFLLISYALVSFCALFHAFYLDMQTHTQVDTAHADQIGQQPESAGAAKRVAPAQRERHHMGAASAGGSPGWEAAFVNGDEYPMQSDSPYREMQTEERFLPVHSEHTLPH